MKNYELEHSGVKGMRWRKGRKTPLELETNLEKKKVDPNARIESQKNLTLAGTKNKKFNMTENEVDQKTARTEMNDSIKTEEQKAKEERQKIARNAQQAALKNAKKRAKEEETKEPETPKKKTVTNSSTRIIRYTGRTWITR